MVYNKKQIKELRRLNPHATIEDLAQAIEITNGYSDLIVDREELRKLLGE